MTSLASSGATSRRDEIVTIARRIFAGRGYTSTSMRDIAEASGLMAGSLYSHFRSKAEILRLVLSPLLDALEPAQEDVLASEGSGLQRLERMIQVVLDILAAHSDETTIVHYDWSELSQTPELEDLAQRSNGLIDLWRRVVVAGQEDGSIRTDVRPEVAVRAVTSALLASVDTKRYVTLALPATAVRRGELGAELMLLFSAGLGARPGAGRAAPARRTDRTDQPAARRR